MAETESSTVAPIGGGAGPCQNYRVDLTATGFAICKCGYPRDAHGEKQENRASQVLSNFRKTQTSAGGGDSLSNGSGKPCKLYRIDVTAQRFGDCKCGFPKDAHVEKDMNNAAKALKKLRSTQSAKDNFRARTGKPCDNYKVDTTAENFGTCLCGFPKDDHVEKEKNPALKAKEELEKRNEERKRIEDMKAMGIEPELEKAEKKAAAKTTPKNTSGSADKPASGGCCTIS